MTQVPMPYFTLVFERKNLPHKYFTVNNKQTLTRKVRIGPTFSIANVGAF